MDGEVGGRGGGEGVEVVEWPSACGGEDSAAEAGVREEGRDAVVAGPVVEAGVGVPLEEIEGVLDGADVWTGFQEASSKWALLSSRRGCGAAPVVGDERSGR